MGPLDKSQKKLMRYNDHQSVQWGHAAGPEISWWSDYNMIVKKHKCQGISFTLHRVIRANFMLDNTAVKPISPFEEWLFFGDMPKKYVFPLDTCKTWNQKPQ